MTKGACTAAIDSCVGNLSSIPNGATRIGCNAGISRSVPCAGCCDKLVLLGASVCLAQSVTRGMESGSLWRGYLDSGGFQVDA